MWFFIEFQRLECAKAVAKIGFLRHFATLVTVHQEIEAGIGAGEAVLPTGFW